MNQTVFTHATARVRALEPKLLDSTEVERMLGASNAKEAYKILNDLEYANHVGDIEKVTNFQEVITAGLKDSKEVIDRICPDERILDVLFLKYDFHNIKTILKGMRAEKSQEEIKAQLLPLGRISEDEIMRYFFDKDVEYLPIREDYMAAIKGWVEVAKSRETVRLLDLVLDHAAFALTLDIAKMTENEFVIEFVKKSIDLQNIKSFLRVKLLKQEESFEGEKSDFLFVRGGKVALYKFKDNMDADINSIAGIFRGTDYEEVVKNGIESFEKSKSFVYMEKYADEYLMAFAKKARYSAFGPQAIIAYFHAKQNNAQIIRMIMVGKLNNIPKDMLRERLHELYV